MRKVGLAFALGLVVLAGCVGGPADHLKAETSPAIYLRVPTHQEKTALYPQEARRRGVAGTVVMACQVLRDQRLHDCLIREESPAGLGFGEATLRAAPYFRGRPERIDGVEKESSDFIVTMVWSLEG